MKPPVASCNVTVALCRNAAMLAFLAYPGLAAPQTSGAPNSPSSMEQRLQRLEQRQQQLEDELRRKDAEIQQLKNAQAQPAAGAATAPSPSALAASPTPTVAPAEPGATVEDNAPTPPPPSKWATYTPGLGFTVANTDLGALSVSAYTYARYVNQKGLDSSYTNSFGITSAVQQRNDIFLNKAVIRISGWVLDPDFRYLLYTWTNNTAQGLGAQVVVAGSLGYNFNKYFTLAAGVDGLPGVRTLEAQFPNWLPVDNRQIADEFFRPSYTFGVFARGQITDTLRYRIMLGNNMSALGVSSAQLDNHLGTVSSALVWEPTADYGTGYGDFEYHERLSSRLGAHFTHSTEDKQSQPNTDAFSNTQIRLSDGTVVFTSNIFGPGITVNQLQVYMEDVDFGLKYRGWSLEGEYYLRQLNHFQGPGTSGLQQINNNGFQLLLSDMVIPKTLQLYVGGSRVAGDYGNPYDARFGANVFPFKNKIVRWNMQVIYLDRSPVGNSTLPYPLGAKGFTFNTDFELAL